MTPVTNQRTVQVSAATVKLHQFLRDEGLSTHGVTRKEMLMLPSRTFWQNLDFIDWLLPADAFGATSTETGAPQLDKRELASIVGDLHLHPSYLANYLKFASVFGLVVDHHGWVFHEKTAREFETPQLLLLKEPRVAARALRFLALTAIQGYSRGGTTRSLRYVDGLMERLRADWALWYPDGRPYPAIWEEAAVA